MKKLVMFDFDGVICDSFEHGIAVNKQLNIDYSPEAYRKLFDGNIYRVISDKLGEYEGSKRVTAFFELMANQYHALPYFDGIGAALEDLSKKYAMSIVSSTTNELIERSCLINNIRHYFDEIMGLDVHASKVEKMKMLMRSHSVTHDQCVFVTDTLGDVREASIVGIDAIGVLWGFHEYERLLQAHVAHFAHRPDELPRLIDSHFSKICECANQRDNSRC